MNCHVFCFLLIIGFHTSMIAAGQKKYIFIEASAPEGYKGDSVVLYVSRVFMSNFDDPEVKYKAEILNNVAKFKVPADSALRIQNLPFSNYEHLPYLAEPGDDIHIKYTKNGVSFEGVGSERFDLVYQLNAIIRSTSRPENDKYTSTISIGDYLAYTNYIKTVYRSQVQILDKRRARVGEFNYLYFMGVCLDQARFLLIQKFWNLSSLKGAYELSSNQLDEIFDSTLSRYKKGPMDENDTSSLAYDMGLRFFMNQELLSSRDYEPYESNLERHIKEYYFIKKNLSGLARERALVSLLTYSLLRKSVDSNHIDLVRDYLSTSDYPEYKRYVKIYLDKRLALSKGRKAMDFELISDHGSKVSLSDLKGKVVVIDFWFTGCKGCVQMVPGLKNAEDAFRDDSNVVFLSVSIDNNKDQWINSIRKGKYTTGTSMNLYTGGKGADHPVIMSYNVTAFPQIFVIDPMGMFTTAVPDPRKDSGRGLIELVGKTLVSQSDGPYVLFKKDKVEVKKVSFDGGKKKAVVYSLNSINGHHLNVGTDIPGRQFDVSLKKEVKNERCVYERPQKMLVLSDIEGNFDALRQLLQRNNVIDQDFNWVFGDGHLVLSGDIFDRGEQVLECLWLIYSLEEDAKSAGGYVHYILGNHEVMNLSGDTRYVHFKYLDGTASILGENYSTLFDDESELGRWLRTKNIMEKVGDMLLVHGGISREVNRLSLSIEQINDLARSYYDRREEAEASQDSHLVALYGAAQKPSPSPFWNRAYYDNDGDPKKATMDQVDSTLRKFMVKRIITGHTIVGQGDRVTTHYDNKVINTDTDHAQGKREGLLIVGNKYYRINSNGGISLLFEEPQKVQPVNQTE